MSTYPKELLREVDEETLRRWKSRIEDMESRLQSEREKIEAELEGRR